MRKSLIAPCGMNCALCSAYLRDKNSCLGCNSNDINLPKYCQLCIIKNCDILKTQNWKFCSTKCDKFPCKRLKDLDKRYHSKYHMSMLDNLKTIEEQGIRKFLEHEKQRWTCSKCEGVICVHSGKCIKCGQELP